MPDCESAILVPKSTSATKVSAQLPTLLVKFIARGSLRGKRAADRKSRLPSISASSSSGIASAG